MLTVAAAVATGCSASTPAATHPAAAHSAAPPASLAVRPFLDRLHSVRRIARTVPANGDLNPYGITVVPQTTGRLVKGDTLVSNFNAKGNVQGTGTTIVQISPGGTVAPFARLSRLPSGLSCPGGVGLTTALGRSGTLYVVSTISNAILAIPAAATRTSAARAGSQVLTSGGALNGPLGLTLAPNGDLIAVNGNNGYAVEVTASGEQTATVRLIRRGAGALFGITPQASVHGLLFVNDGKNAMDLLSRG